LLAVLYLGAKSPTWQTDTTPPWRTGTDILLNEQYYEVTAKNQTKAENGSSDVLIAGGQTRTNYSDDRGADAQYYQPIDPPLHDKWARLEKPVVLLRNVYDFGDWAAATDSYHYNHTYSQIVRGKGTYLKAQFSDINQSDNAGIIEITSKRVPVVQLTSTGIGKETNQITARFTVTRTNVEVSEPLRVYLKRSGTAVHGTADDYTFSSNVKYDRRPNLHYVEIPGGSPSVDLWVKPNDDSLVEPSKETATISIVHPKTHSWFMAKNYVIHATNHTRTVEIYDNDHVPDFLPGNDSYVVNISPYQPAGPLPESVGGYAVTKAYDLDPGDTLKYSLAQGDSTKFSVNRDTGVVSLKVPATQLPLREYNLKVRVRDARGHEDFGFVQVKKLPRVGVGGVTKAIEGKTKFLIEFLRFDTTDKDLTIQFQTLWGPDFIAEATNVNYNDFTNDVELKKFNHSTKIVIPKNKASVTIALSPKQDNSTTPEGIEEFKIIVLRTSDYVPVQGWENVIINDKTHEGKESLDFSILEGVTPFVKGAANKPTDDLGLHSNNLGVHYNDINQGFVGNCDMMATIASIAMLDYTLIQNIIAFDGLDTYTISFSNAKPVQITQAELLIGYEQLSGDISPAGDVEVWTVLLEKAFRLAKSIDCAAVAQMAAALGKPNPFSISRTQAVFSAADITAINTNINASPLRPVMLGTMNDKLVEGHPKTTFPSDFNNYSFKVYNSNSDERKLSHRHMYVVIGVVPASAIGLAGTDKYLKLYNPHGVGNERFLKFDQQTLDYFFDEIHVFK
jgi:Calpain family cysteine protease